MVKRKDAENELPAKSHNAQKVLRSHVAELDLLQKKADAASSAVSQKFQAIKKDGWTIKSVKSVLKDRDAKKELLQQAEQEKREIRALLGIPELFDWKEGEQEEEESNAA